MGIVATGTQLRLKISLKPQGEEPLGVGRPEIELGRPETAASAIAALRPDVVVGAGLRVAMTLERADQC